MRVIEKKLREFFDKGKLEVRKETEKYDDGNVSAWINYYDILEFINIFGEDLFSEEGVDCNMRPDSLWIDFSFILDFYDIEESYFIN